MLDVRISEIEINTKKRDTRSMRFFLEIISDDKIAEAIRRVLAK